MTVKTDNQSGIASIAIILIILVILSTIVLGFSQIIRREQRRSLDRQLSSQAFYAAETGINDAVKALDKGFSEAKTDCAPYQDASHLSTYPELSGVSNKLLENGNVQYSCLLIDVQPQTLVYDNVDSNKSLVFPIQPETGRSLNSIVFAWQDKDSNITRFRTSGGFPPQSVWNSPPTTGVIRLDLIPVVGASFTKDDLANRARTYFLYPYENATAYSATNYTAIPAANYTSTVSGEIVSGRCHATNNNPRRCLARFDGFPAGTTKVFARVKSIYRPSSMEIVAHDSAGQVRLINAQTLVDSTGKAVDVLRRVQVRVPTLQDLNLPESVLSSNTTLCKKFSLTPLGVRSDQSSEPFCNPSP